jgi:hypothetical protein
LRWERKTSQYSNGWDGILGKYVVFQCIWDPCASDKSKPHCLKSGLPGLKSDLGNFETSEQAFAYAERALAVWLKNAELRS